MLTTPSSPLSASEPPVSLSPVAAEPPAGLFTDLDAERRLLAATLRDPAAMSKLKLPLLLCDFSRLEHRCLLNACQRLRQAEAVPTPQALEAEFHDHPHCAALAGERNARNLHPRRAACARQ